MRMRSFLIVAASGAALAASSQAQDDADARAAIFACVRDNAARVEQAFDSLTEAVDFLVNRICAKPVADAAEIAAKAEEEARQARWDELCAGAEGADPFDTAASQLQAQCATREFNDIYTDRFGYAAIIRMSGVGAADAETISLASSLVLDARLARLAAEDR